MPDKTLRYICKLKEKLVNAKMRLSSSEVHRQVFGV